ncbi:AfsR/SARP family transcriptional regulator [Allokutzneria oryzae]|uniref:BTAD domain-containing putative transcriptional regulator n=1 Tax=Allokutzneria oryzae TaxID=1378989 RepID=A0ABV6A1Q7_9PSEU
MLDLRILGDVRAHRDGQPVELGTGQQCTLLAVLLVEANREVTSARLARYLWGSRPPTSAKSCIQVHVSRLRTLLADPDFAIRAVPGGYRLDIDPEQVDLGRFIRLVELAGRQEDWVAVPLYREALALWRGRPLAMVEHTAPLTRALTERYLLELENSIEARLRLGEHQQLVPELITASHENPLRPRLTAALMTALYRAGRAAEALRYYEHTRWMLADELGLEPHADLRRLQEAVLRDDPALNLLTSR